MPKQKEVTIYDIARELNISAATVSRALKDDPVVNNKTKKKIFDLANKIGYRTNLFARNLRTQETKTIGFLIHELTSNFCTCVLAGVEKVTTKAGYDLIIAHSSESYEKEVANARNLFNKRVDGLIASLAFDTKNLDHFKSFSDKAVPVVFFDRVEKNSGNTVVVIDNYKSGYLATKHLIDMGCKRIAHLTSSLTRNVYSDRLRGYKAALKEGGLSFNENMLFVDNLSEEAGMETAKKIVKQKPMPDGIFITNDFVAASFIKTLKGLGVSVPDDMAVVGFNNDAISHLIEPDLTTINYPGREVGEAAAHALLNQLKEMNKSPKAKTIIINSDLIVRASSQKRKKLNNKKI